ncbi:hypothetical protein [Marivivens marinus]|uniref:hypothetical protein n=1 Tax=Marivivens marinus TaxID=3110173 RepID=UPI003B84660B
MGYELNKSKRVLPCIALVAFSLTGCGGSSTGSTPIESLYDSRVSELATARSDAMALGREDTVALPTSGSATYEGDMRLDVSPTAGPDRSIVGDFYIDVSFAAGNSSAFDGAASGFIDSNDQDYSGTLIISGGQIFRLVNPAAGATLDSFIDGDLIGPNGEVISVDGLTIGDLYGLGYTFVVGDVIGDAMVDGVAADLSGEFLGVQGAP